MRFIGTSEGTAKTGHGMYETTRPRRYRPTNGASQLHKPPVPVLVDMEAEVPGGLCISCVEFIGTSDSQFEFFLKALRAR